MIGLEKNEKLITVIIYGRNDTHGYNLHKRAALSLNNIASYLNDDDEIIFVDWNTPIGYSSFPEAISDTLNKKTKELLKIIRVPQRLHDQITLNPTRLTLEPVARNVAIKRSNPKNKWILSTNTDMIFLLKKGEKFADIIHDLEPGYYGIPRFSIPDSIWEKLNRSDTSETNKLLRKLTTEIDLKENVTAGPVYGFDAPGDFQLFTRQDIISLGGFDETMLLGWHVDSNLAKRFNIYFGFTKSLEHVIEGFHCEHNKISTQFTNSNLSNDINLYINLIQNPIAKHNGLNWGLEHENLATFKLTTKENIDLETLIKFAPNPKITRIELPTEIVGDLISYPITHALPYVLELFEGSESNRNVGYIGPENNKTSFELLEKSLKYKYDISLINLNLEILNQKQIQMQLMSKVGVANKFQELIVDFGYGKIENPQVSYETHASTNWEFSISLKNIIRNFILIVYNGFKVGSLDENTRIITINAETYGYGVGNRIKWLSKAQGSNPNTRVRFSYIKKTIVNRSEEIINKFIERSTEILPTARNFNQDIDAEEWSKNLAKGLTSHQIFDFLISPKKVYFNMSGTEVCVGSSFTILNPGKIFDSIHIEFDYPNQYFRSEITDLKIFNHETIFLFDKYPFQHGSIFIAKLENLISDNEYLDLKFEFKTQDGRWDSQNSSIPSLRILNIIGFNKETKINKIGNLARPQIVKFLTQGWSFSNEHKHRWAVHPTVELDFTNLPTSYATFAMVVRDFRVDDFEVYKSSLNITSRPYNLIRKRWGKVFIFREKELNKYQIKYNGAAYLPGELSIRNNRTLFFKGTIYLLFRHNYPNFVLKVILNAYHISNLIIEKLGKK